MPVRMRENTTIVGYRLVPGAELAHDSSEDPDSAIAGGLDDVFCYRRVAEALSVIALVSLRVNEAAGLPGRSRRT
jgi:hypothetical protein